LLERGELAAVGCALLEHGLEGPRDEPTRGACHRRGSHELLRPRGAVVRSEKGECAWGGREGWREIWRGCEI
jgi:hypothetical protein